MIKNISKKTIIAKDYDLFERIIGKSIGLMFQKPRPIIFTFNKEKNIPLHMFFVFSPIDVIFLNKQKIVVELKENFRPFTFYNPKKKAKYVIELEVKTIKKSKTKIKDKIEFKACR